MTRLSDFFSPEAIEAMQRASRAVATFEDAVSSVAEKLRPQILEFQRSLELIREHPTIKRAGSIERARTFSHPVYEEFFEAEFTPQEIQKNWVPIRDWLVSRFPEDMDFDHRKQRYLQFVECQNIGAYIAVCRSVYSEIESVFRDELLLADPQWVAARDAEQKPTKRRGFQSKETSNLLKNSHNAKKLIDDETLISDIGPYAASFVLTLTASFESFDPAEPNKAVRQSQRHLHCHGWAKSASFQDGLNALLLLDMTYQFIPELKEKNKERKAVTL